jgi:hypothetical protein
MEQNKGRSNAESLFGIERVPSDNQMRNLLDPVTPKYLFPGFGQAVDILETKGELDTFRSHNNNLHIALDGLCYFSSQHIHCQNCSHRTSSKGNTTYFHNVITPVIVAPGNKRVIAIEPEFILPQDGHKKQDCEQAAANGMCQVQ